MKKWETWVGAYVVVMMNHPYGFLSRSWDLCKVVGGLLRIVLQGFRFQPDTQRLELTKLEQNQYWWVESERYFEAHRVLFRANDLPPHKPIRIRIPRKPEPTNIMAISTTIWENAVKEIAKLRDRINNWPGFREVGIKDMVTRLKILKSRMKRI
uniref:Uncharacterized protein n=1 Tax=Tanacetum cinerariifolium TaxID=118510 RepID=A0A699HEF7_TANCI|nr:hypothetical protein [Tanacetum cinerariifolium]